MQGIAISPLNPLLFQLCVAVEHMSAACRNQHSLGMSILKSLQHPMRIQFDNENEPGVHRQSLTKYGLLDAMTVTASHDTQILAP